MDPDYSSYHSAGEELGLDLTPDQYRLLVRYTEVLRDWNTRMNLVSRRDTGRVLTYHVVDSLAACPLVPARARVADLGSGAGLPGIPLAIARPDTEVVLVEAQQKRSQFLHAALAELGLENARVLPRRAEEVSGLECDVVLSRLTGPFADALRHAACLRRPGGTIIFYKTASFPAELTRSGRILARLRLRVLDQHDVVLPFTGIVRRLVVVGGD